MMVSMSGCNATAVADIIGVTVDDTKLELRVRMVDKPHIVSEFESHPKQASGVALASTTMLLFVLPYCTVLARDRTFTQIISTENVALHHMLRRHLV